MLALMAVITVFSALVRAPLLENANFNQTPNPARRPGTSWASRNSSPSGTRWWRA